jgi:hypothetical protein
VVEMKGLKERGKERCNNTVWERYLGSGLRRNNGRQSLSNVAISNVVPPFILVHV